MNDLNITALYVYYKYLLNMLLLRNGFTCLFIKCKILSQRGESLGIKLKRNILTGISFLYWSTITPYDIPWGIRDTKSIELMQGTDHYTFEGSGVGHWVISLSKNFSQLQVVQDSFPYVCLSIGQSSHRPLPSIRRIIVKYYDQWTILACYIFNKTDKDNLFNQVWFFFSNSNHRQENKNKKHLALLRKD